VARHTPSGIRQRRRRATAGVPFHARVRRCSITDPAVLGGPGGGGA